MRTGIVALVSLVVGLLVGLNWQTLTHRLHHRSSQTTLAFEPIWAKDDNTIEEQIEKVDKKLRSHIVTPKGEIVAEVLTPPVEIRDPKDMLSVLYLDFRRNTPRVMMPVGWEKYGPSGEETHPADLHNRVPKGAILTGFGFVGGPKRLGKHVLCATVSPVEDGRKEALNPLLPNVHRYPAIEMPPYR